MKRIVLLCAVLVLSGCVSIAKIETGQHAVGDRLTVNIEGAWNHINAPGMGPAQVWTMEGMAVDQLLLYSGIRDGQAVHSGGGNDNQKSMTYRSNMQPDEIAALFEGMLTRDGSRYRLSKLEPVSLGDLKGLRFEYSLVRKIDNVQLAGVGYAATSRGELFALLYMAPRLVFYPRHIARVEHIGQSMRIKP
ncbi:MAG: hypothetical protein KIT13_01870 [Burkholderiales bacterium]|nr:hypothetical protein [Burkholderiales bacterium]